MVAAATRPVTLSKVDAPQPSGPRRQFVRRLLLVAAALMFALPSVAWFLRGSKLTDTHKDSFSIALATLIEPDQPSDRQQLAVLTVYRYCITTCDLLKAVAADPDERVRDVAGRLRASALAIIDGHSKRQPRQVGGDFEKDCARAADTSLQREPRIKALGSIGAYLESGLSALVSTTIENTQIANGMFSYLRAALRD